MRDDIMGGKKRKLFLYIIVFLTILVLLVPIFIYKGVNVINAKTNEQNRSVTVLKDEEQENPDESVAENGFQMKQEDSEDKNKENSDTLVVDTLLKANNSEIIKLVMQNPEDFKIQILYTEIKKNQGDSVKFISHKYMVDENKYFYPASTLKLAAALVALEKLKKLDADLDTLIVEDEYSKTFRELIRDAIVVSDNLSFDLLFDFIGYENFNNTMWEKGYRSFKIYHRLYFDLVGNENNALNLVKDGKVIYNEPYRQGYLDMSNKGLDDLIIGNSFYKDGELYKMPFNFEYRNAVSIEDLQKMLKFVFFPQTVLESDRFDIREEDINFLKQQMLGVNDGTHKWLISGGKEDGIPEDVQIYGKSGICFGFMTDNAYIRDNEGNEFFMTAVIFCDRDNVIYEDESCYDYDDIGMPFMRDLGKVFLNLTKERNKNQ